MTEQTEAFDPDQFALVDEDGNPIEITADEARELLAELLEALANEDPYEGEYIGDVRDDPDFIYASNDPDNGNQFGIFMDRFPSENPDDDPTPGLYFEAGGAEVVRPGAFLPYFNVPHAAFAMLDAYARMLEIPGLVEAVEDAEVALSDAFKELAAEAING
jgi:hypothetical protein